MALRHEPHPAWPSLRRRPPRVRWYRSTSPDSGRRWSLPPRLACRRRRTAPPPPPPPYCDRWRSTAPPPTADDSRRRWRPRYAAHGMALRCAAAGVTKVASKSPQKLLLDAQNRAHAMEHISSLVTLYFYRIHELATCGCSPLFEAPHVVDTRWLQERQRVRKRDGIGQAA